MPSVEIRRARHDATTAELVRTVNRLIDRDLGNSPGRVWLTGGDDGQKKDLHHPNDPPLSTGNYPLRVQSAAGQHAQITHSSGTPDVLRVQDSGVTVSTLAVTGNATIGGTLTVTGATTLNNALTVAGLATFNGSVIVGDAAADTLTVNATSSFVAPITIQTTSSLTCAAPANFTANVVIGDAPTDTLTVLAAGTFSALATFNAGATFAAGQPVTGNGTLQFKTPTSGAASSALTLTTSPVTIPGCTLNLAPGRWQVTGSIDFQVLGTDAGQTLIGLVVASGGSATITGAGQSLLFQAPTAPARSMLAQVWLVTVTATATISLQAYKGGGAGTSFAGTHSTITAINA